MVVDIVLALVIAYGFYLGFNRGIIKTIFSILAYVIGVIAAFKFSPAMTDFLQSAFGSNSPFMYLAGFIATFILTMFLIRLFARGLEGVLQTVHVTLVNQVSGGVLLSAVFILIYSLLLWFADSSGIIDNGTKKTSLTFPYLEKYPEYVWDASKTLQPIFVDFWDHTVDFMDQVQQKTIERTESDPYYYDLDEENQ